MATQAKEDENSQCEFVIPRHGIGKSWQGGFSTKPADSGYESYKSEPGGGGPSQLATEHHRCNTSCKEQEANTPIHCEQ
jgi:hypothetical protein